MTNHKPISYGEYEEQIESGFLGLKFTSAIEDDYLLTQLKTRRSILLVFWVAFLLYQSVLLTQDGVQILPPYPFVLLFARIVLVFVPLLGGILTLAYSKSAKQAQWFMGVAALTVGVGSLVLICLPNPDARYFILPGLFYLFFLFVLSGIAFRITLLVGVLLAAVIVAICFSYDTQTMGLPDNTLFWLCSFTLAGLIHSYHREYISRWSYLKNARLSCCIENDAETGLHTLCAFDGHLKRVWRQAIRDRLPIAMVLIDSSDLAHGLASTKSSVVVGAETLIREMADLLGEVQNRPLDMVARFESTQFAILWYGAHPEVVRTMANDVKEKLEKLFIRWAGDNHQDVLVFEVGVAVAIPAQGDKENELVKLSKEALMLAREDVSTNIIVRYFDRNWPADLITPTDLEQDE